MVIDFFLAIAAILAGGAVAGVVSYLVGRRVERRLAAAAGRGAEQQAGRVLDGARREADAARAEAVLAAKEEIIKGRELWEQEAQRRRQEVERVERRLEEREAHLDRKVGALEQREQEVEKRDRSVAEREKHARATEDELARALQAQRSKLEQISGMSAGAAKAELIRGLAKADAAALARDIKEEAKRNAEREAKKIVALAVQRISPEITAETSVSAVALPSDDMKGRIIGREGRNIRAFETATGVDVIIDDTPDTVIVSCFDPVRREVARLALEQLIQDGRIHPGRIEEIVAKVKKEVDASIVEAGEQATYELAIHGMHPELMKLVGTMKYRTSYGQNMYRHSKEVAWLAGIMAAELGLDVHLARRGGLLHDVGKVLSHVQDGTHVQLGVEVAAKYGEHPVVINCIAAHHDDVPHESPISVLVQAADAASGSRPGARREAFETYVKRLTRLEEIATSFNGVEKAFAIQAGRELRIAVLPDTVDDRQAVQLAEDIARRIEGELQYPGQIRVVVIRETRAVNVAR
ncbi:MAG: ribonuclease Y [Gemmatimonadetes bacterium]|nr:ribonuclease Y [Gemmatimonadota bacterium]